MIDKLLLPSSPTETGQTTSRQRRHGTARLSDHSVTSGLL